MESYSLTSFQYVLFLSTFIISSIPEFQIIIIKTDISFVTPSIGWCTLPVAANSLLLFWCWSSDWVSFLSSSYFPYFLSLWFLAFIYFHFLFAVPPMDIFSGGSGLSPSKEVNKGDIIITLVGGGLIPASVPRAKDSNAAKCCLLCL